MKESHVVGESLQPCLRVVPIAEENRHQMVLYEPRNLHYFPLRASLIQDVEVILMTDAATHVPFERGSTVVTLAVRRCSPFEN